MKNINLNAKQTERYSDPERYFLAEFSFDEFVTEDNQGVDPAVGQLVQRLLEMGVPLETIERMATALRGYANEAKVRLKQDGSDLPGWIRVFCPGLMTGDANSAKMPRLCTAEGGTNPAETFHPSPTKLNGGWGYYAIERGRDKEAGRVVELYFYQEGK